jgi:hypothetical protein
MVSVKFIHVFVLPKQDLYVVFLVQLLYMSVYACHRVADYLH